MFFGMTWYQVFWYFLVYSVGGWMLEVIFHGVTMGKVVNRGFLNGPVCPVYGFGVISVLAMATLLGAGNTEAVEHVATWKLFLGGMLLATAVELIAGFLLDKLFHARWWDYSDLPMNFHGYICAEFSLAWGVAIAFVVSVLQPHVRKLTVDLFPEKLGWLLLGACYLVYLLDLILTVLTLARINRELAEIDNLSHGLRAVSDGMTRIIGTSAVQVGEKMEEGKTFAEQKAASVVESARTMSQEVSESMEQARDSLTSGATRVKESLTSGISSAGNALGEAVRQTTESVTESALRQKKQMERRYEELMSSLMARSTWVSRRILRTTPELRHRVYGEALEALKKRVQLEYEKKKGKRES